MTCVLVAVPAHDEAQEAGHCLRSVVSAARVAIAAGACSEVRIGVGANRCTDRTAEVVADVATATGQRIHVFDDPDSWTVGAVRARVIRRLVHLAPCDAATTWVFNTDADSRVPPDWISRTLLDIATADVRAVLGMVELNGWRSSRAARARYDAIVSAGIDGDRHSHVYGANLAVRLDAYDRVGGFRAIHAEDQDLVDRLRLHGEPVATTLESTVLTSARMTARAAAGLGELLGRLSAECPAELS